MSAGAWQTWIKRPIAVRWRLGRMCTASLLFLLVATTQPSLQEAARFSGRPPSLCAKLLPSPSHVALTPLDPLATPHARKLAKARERVRGLPWNILLLVDATLQHRARLHPEHAHTFHHGQGSVRGPPWPTIVLVRGDIFLPLPPMPCASQASCRTHGLTDQSEPQRVVAYLKARDLAGYLGAYDRREVVVGAASGYAEQTIAPAMAHKGWHCLIALGKTRRVTATARALRSPTAKPWLPVDPFFRRHRRRTWATVRLPTSGNKRTRRALRLRHTPGSVRQGGQGELGCADRRNRPDGRRTSLACHELRATPRQMVTGERLRGSVERWQKSVKQHRGFEDVATPTFAAVVSHVHWVYGAYLLLHMSPPGLSPESHSVGDRHRARQQGLADQEKRHILPQWTPSGGVQRYKDELRQALTDA